MLQTDFTKRKYFLIVLVTSCVLLSTLTFTLYRQADVMEEHNSWVLHSYEVLRVNSLIMNNLLDLETGQRGYLLTGKAEFLEPFEKGGRTLASSLERMKELFAGDEELTERLKLAEKDALEVKALLESQIKRFAQNKSYTLTTDDIKQSKQAMDEVRESLESINNVEMSILKNHLIQLKQNQRNYFIFLFVGSTLAIGGLLIANGVIIALIFKGRKTAEELRESETRYGLVLQGVNDGIYEHNVSSGVMHFSPSYKQLLGYDPEEMPKHKNDFMQLIHPDDRQKVKEDVRRYQDKEIEHYSSLFRIKHKSGNYRWILSRGMGEWNRRGQLKRMIGTHTDLTEQKSFEEQLKQINADLESFTYIASHDLRAPLVNLKGFAAEIQYSLDSAYDSIKALLPGAKEEDRKIIENSIEKDIPESLQFIRTAVRKMDTITNAILDLSRIGRRAFKPELVDTQQMVKRSIESQSYEASERDIEFIYDQLPKVTADAVALEQVLSNILDNAIKFLDPARKGMIEITATALPGETMFCVKDNGRGIADADHKKVFDVFRRAGNAGDVRGTGMGMAYVKATLRRMGGRIWFHSRLGEGTSFYFTIPDTPPQAD